MLALGKVDIVLLLSLFFQINTWNPGLGIVDVLIFVLAHATSIVVSYFPTPVE